ncbi:MAG: acylphosphatase [Desulfobacterales bacterium]|nr:acylphosphatase [Desulfobacterales bacterium]
MQEQRLCIRPIRKARWRMAENVRAHVIITGRVQGVALPRRHPLGGPAHRGHGWVRNRRDGSVEAVVEGERARWSEMLAWCRQGSALARVDDVTLEWEPYRGEFTDFSIVR